LGVAVVVVVVVVVVVPFKSPTNQLLLSKKTKTRKKKTRNGNVYEMTRQGSCCYCCYWRWRRRGERTFFSAITMSLSVNAKSKSVFNIHNITVIVLLFTLHVDGVVVFIVVLEVRKTHGKKNRPPSFSASTFFFDPFDKFVTIKVINITNNIINPFIKLQQPRHTEFQQ
jgi:hypothetical protein